MTQSTTISRFTTLLLFLALESRVFSFVSKSDYLSTRRVTCASMKSKKTVDVKKSSLEMALKGKRPPYNFRRAFIASTAIIGAQLFSAQAAIPPGFKRIPIQFVAALGDPKANSGNNANDWGLWPVDPGPRGVMLSQYKSLQSSGGKAPAGWFFDENDWWLEEHGLIMEAPQFPLAPGRYLVTGGRSVTTGLTIGPKDAKTGAQSWKLDDENAQLYDVTHLPCRSARYTPKKEDNPGSPATAKASDFPVTPGAVMPEVSGCNKQDYAVLFVIGVETVKNA